MLLVDTFNIESLLDRIRKKYKSQILGSAVQLYNKRINRIAEKLGVDIYSIKKISKTDVSIWSDYINRKFSIVNVAPDKIKGYNISQILVTLNRLDFITYYKKIRKDDSIDEVLLNQPGIRYNQAVQIVIALCEILSNSTSTSKDDLYNQILEDIEGRLLEEVIVVNMIQLYGDIYEVYKYESDIGETDIVVEEKGTNRIDLIEVKRSSQIIPEYQAKWLIDKSIENELTQDKGKSIQNRYIFYLGKTQDIVFNNTIIKYINTFEFFNSSNRE